MVLAVASHLLSDNVGILKGAVSKTAYQGVFIAVGSSVVATSLVSLYGMGAARGICDEKMNSGLKKPGNLTKPLFS
jgi:hypothetical protein